MDLGQSIKMHAGQTIVMGGQQEESVDELL